MLLLAAARATAYSAPTPTPSVERWGLFQLNLNAPTAAMANPFDTPISATFTLGSTTMTVDGFYDGGDDFRVRFSPPQEGSWSYKTVSPTATLDGVSGTLVATSPAPGQRGPVESKGYGLYYADGTPHFSTGTTCYQWSSKDFAMQEQTLETLKSAKSFNKIRMTVFPKWYVYNHANPVETGTAYEVLPGSVAANASAWACVGGDCPSTAGSFDLERFNVSYWRNYERLLGRLRALDIVADIIVFHPYDGGHWGFDCMGGRDADTYDTTHDKRYLRYLAARLSAYSNVWWAMANEWSFNQCKGRGVVDQGDGQATSPVWDELFEALSAADPHGRQMSIHNGNLLYNHSRPWISHVSLQGHENDTAALRTRYGKPVVWDEEKYEGTIPEGWGHLTGPQEADRFWWGLSLGAHAGHSETVLRADTPDDAQPLWWAKGGELVGSSPPRIAWLSQWAATEQLDLGQLQPQLLPPGCAPNGPGSGSGAAATHGDASRADPPLCWGSMLSKPGAWAFVHFLTAGQWEVPLLQGGGPVHGRGDAWSVSEVDYWNMTERPIGHGVPTKAGVLVEVKALPYNAVFRVFTA